MTVKLRAGRQAVQTGSMEGSSDRWKAVQTGSCGRCRQDVWKADQTGLVEGIADWACGRQAML